LNHHHKAEQNNKYMLVALALEPALEQVLVLE